MKLMGLAFIWLFVFFIPCESVVMIPGVGTVSRMVGLQSFTVGMIATLYLNRIRTLLAVHWVLFVFMLWSLLTYVWSINPEQSLVRCWTYGQLMVMVWLLWQWTPDVFSIMRLFMAYVAGAYVSIGFTFYNFLSNKQVVWQRYSATGFDPNELGLILALGIPISWYVSLKAEKFWQIIAFRFYFIAAASAIVLTASRMAVITAILASLFIIFTFTHLSNKSKIF